MSNKTFIMSSNHSESAVSLSHRGLHLVLLPEGHYTNSSMPVSPDSNSSISNMSDTEASSYPDINSVETCLRDSSSTQDDVLYEGTLNMNQTFIATSENGSVRFWNETLNIPYNEEDSSNNDKSFDKYTENKDSNAGTCRESIVADSRLSSSETSCRGSVENDCFSFSSIDMVTRSNSVCLDNQSPIISSLEDNSCARHDLQALTFALPDGSEKSSEEVKADVTGHPSLGVTFNQADTWELPTENSDTTCSSALVALPSENERGHLMTFICETPSDHDEELRLNNIDEKPLPCLAEAITPEQRKPFVSTVSAVLESDKDIHTSTPIQSIEYQTLGLPSFSMSRIGSESSPANSSVIQPQSFATHKHCVVVGLPPSASKNKKMDIKTFPKTDFSNVKSKVMTRAYNYKAASGLSSQYRQTHGSVNIKYSETHKVTAFKICPTKLKTNSAASAATSKMVKDSQRHMDTGLAGTGATMNPTVGHPFVGVRSENVVPLSKNSAATRDDAPADQQANTKQAISTKESESQISSRKSPGRCSQRAVPLKKVMTNKVEIGPGSACGQDKPPVKTRLRCSSDGSASASRSPKEKKKIRFSTSLSIPKVDNPAVKTKAVLACSQRNQSNGMETPNDDSPREVKKISLVAEASKSTPVLESEMKSRVQASPSTRQHRGTPLHPATAASPKPSALSAKLKLETLGKHDFRTSKAAVAPQSKQKSNTGHQRTPSTGRQPLGTPLSRLKLQLNGARPHQTPVLNGLPSTPSVRPQRKTLGASKNPTEASKTQSTGKTQVSEGVAHKTTPLKSVVTKARLFTSSRKNHGTDLNTACSPAVFTTKVGPSMTTNLRRTVSARYVRPTLAAPPVDKTKSKGGTNQQPPQPPSNVPETNRRDDVLQQLKGLLAASNRRFEAVAIILQQTLIERDEATNQCSKLSQELVNLKGELVCSTQSSQHLEKEKEELRVALEDALHTLQGEHQRDLAELEQRLQTFYQAEWDKVHVSYQEEADRCRTLMQQQMTELKASHEVMTLELKNSYEEQLQCVIGQYEKTLEELGRVHEEELQSLDRNLKEAESAMSEQIKELTAENTALTERLAAEENRRKEVADKSQKDLHALYLEKELESLKVVLDIKTKQLHQQEKKLMEIDKVTEKSLKLDEHLRKVQLENEDLRARMERHTALSRQLSSEQAMLQESLQKESKVNKRLSMENEELLWKLHNGDLNSPRKVSSATSSPSHSFSLQSPHSAGHFSSPPVSPR